MQLRCFPFSAAAEPQTEDAGRFETEGTTGEHLDDLGKGLCAFHEVMTSLTSTSVTVAACSVPLIGRKLRRLDSRTRWEKKRFTLANASNFSEIAAAAVTRHIGIGECGRNVSGCTRHSAGHSGISV